MADTAAKPSFDAILKLVDDVMKVGTRKYEFSSEVPWFIDTDIVQQRTHSRLTQAGDATLAVHWVEHDLSAAEILGVAASTVYPENDEGLKAIGEHPETQHRNLRRRTEHAAAAQGNVSATSDRYWRGRCMMPFIRLTAKELYRMIHYPDESCQVAAR